MMDLQFAAERAFKDHHSLLVSFLNEESNFARMAELSHGLAHSFQSGKKALICGNGGSSCDAMHFAQEFTGRFRGDRPGLPVIALTDPTHITCVGNDYGFEKIFARGVEAYGKQGDWLFALSTSGNSPNVVAAVDAARKKGMIAVTLLGKNGGKLAGIGDYEWIIPGLTSDRIQEIHMLILHTIIEMVERTLFPANYED